MKRLLAVLFLLASVSADAQFIPGISNPAIIKSATPFTFATWDPATLTGGGVLSGGNLTYSSSGSASVVRSTKFDSTKTYTEITINTLVSGSGIFAAGVFDSSQAVTTPVSVATVPAKFWLDRNDSLALNAGGSSAYGSNYGAGNVISIAIDATIGSGSNKVWVGQCSGGVITWPSSGNPATGANPMFSNLTGLNGIIVNTQTSGTTNVTANFGASAYACTPPTGYGNL